MLRTTVLLITACGCAAGGQSTPVDASLLELEIRALPPRTLDRQILTGPSDLTRKSLKPSVGSRYSHRGPLVSFLSFAFGVSPGRVVGPEWIFSSRYEIYLETRHPVADIRPILQAVLREKYLLDLKQDNVSFRALILKTPNGEPRRARSKHPACTVDDGNAGTATGLQAASDVPAGSPSASATVFFRGCTMSDLASALSARLFTKVINEASATGRYDFDVSIGGLFPYRPGITSGDVERWSEQAAQITAKNLRKSLGADLYSERRELSSILVVNATPLHGTLHLRSK